MPMLPTRSGGSGIEREGIDRKGFFVWEGCGTENTTSARHLSEQIVPATVCVGETKF
jgi:hypothetical protein